MSELTNTNAGSEVTGVGKAILDHVRLNYILRTDPLLGSTSIDVPDGPYNAQLARLQENVGSVANHFVSYLSNTTAVVSGSAPVVGSVVGTPTGSPTNPTVLSYHRVKFSDFLVTYWYDVNLGIWVELTRSASTGSLVQKVNKTLAVVPADNSDSLSFVLPVLDDLGASIVWTVKDIKSVYLEQLGANPVVGLRGSRKVVGSSVTVDFDDTVVVGAHYQLVVNFERVTVS